MSNDQIILIFGEDDNDRRALSNLVRAILPEGFRARISIRRSPTILSRDAVRKRLKMAQEIKAFFEAECTGKNSVYVVVHRDCDCVEPAHAYEEAALRKTLEGIGITNIIIATPAWEIEAWWMLFPEALAAVRGCWKKVNYSGRHVGMIKDAKEQLRRDLRPNVPDAKKCPDFVESDGIAISAVIAQQRLVEGIGSTRSDSFQAFRRQVEALAQ